LSQRVGHLTTNTVLDSNMTTMMDAALSSLRRLTPESQAELDL